MNKICEKDIKNKYTIKEYYLLLIPLQEELNIITNKIYELKKLHPYDWSKEDTLKFNKMLEKYNDKTNTQSN